MYVNMCRCRSLILATGILYWLYVARGSQEERVFIASVSQFQVLVCSVLQTVVAGPGPLVPLSFERMYVVVGASSGAWCNDLDTSRIWCEFPPSQHHAQFSQ